MKEFSGTKAFPNELWHPLDVCQNRDLLEQIGVITPEDDGIPDKLSDAVYFCVWSNFHLMGRSTRKDVGNRIFNQQVNNLDAEVSKNLVKEVYCNLTDE